MEPMPATCCHVSLREQAHTALPLLHLLTYPQLVARLDDLCRLVPFPPVPLGYFEPGAQLNKQAKAAHAYPKEKEAPPLSCKETLALVQLIAIGTPNTLLVIVALEAEVGAG